ncbi:MAG: hypothetical protein KJO54_13025 [Gammaproteobacteria bacterium]|nr:hypothetical protein [Gammaproteobacteria bacterium]NNF61904.1 hypothetical protein [Gammaproteobacteria bacterium]NNM19792.1 hypothetical protein [Gammaproteobacteria bacterium]
MDFRSIKHIAVLSALLYSMGAGAETARGYFELAGSLYNPDWELRENATGLRLSGAWLVTDKLRIRGTYNTADTDFVDLPIRELRGLPFGNWREAGVAYVHPVGSKTRLDLELSYQGVELAGDIESGSGVSVGIQHIFDQRFSGSLRFGWFDLDGSDTRLTGELLTQIGSNVALVTRIDDTAGFDFTWYEVGLRFRF